MSTWRHHDVGYVVGATVLAIAPVGQRLQQEKLVVVVVVVLSPVQVPWMQRG